MSRKWPPSPSVEDEHAALAREHSLHTAIHQMKSDDQPAEIRGSVDQYPIILEVDVPPASKVRRKSRQGDRDDSLTEGQSGDDSSGPGTPPLSNPEKRFVFIPREHVDTTDTEENCPRRSPRSANLPRGRPTIAPIRTDVGGDLPETIAGSRRVLSPYTYHPLQQDRKYMSRTNENLVSPQHGHQPRSEAIIDSKKSGSAMPRNRRDDSSSSTQSDRRPDKGRHRSRRRSTRHDANKHIRSGNVDNQTTDETPAASDSSLKTQRLRDQRKQEEHPSHSQHNAPVFREFPCSSAAEDACVRSREASRSSKRWSRDSPYASCAEEPNSRRQHVDRPVPPAGPRSPRGSVLGSARPPIELSEFHYSYGAGDFGVDKPSGSKQRPGSRSEAIVDVEAAYRRNLSRGSNGGPRLATYPSPLASPARTPPRTPAGDHKHRDYFDHLSTPSQGLRPHSRKSSMDDNLTHDPRSYTTATAPTTVGTPKPMPNLSRSSTTSIDAASHGSASKPPSSQRSRRTSPVYEGQRPVSRAGSYGGSGPNSATGQGPTQSSAERRSTPTLVDPPRPAQRAYSYTPTVEHAHSRPPPVQRMSSITLSPLTPANPPPSTVPHQTRSPILPQSMPPPSAPRPELSLAGLLPCPRPVPVAGQYDWYTMKGVPNIDICPNCVRTLGGTVPRDHFVPSPPKSKYQSVMCSMSRPWVRIAWLQIMKRRMKESDILALLLAVTNIPSATQPCPGKRVEARRWWRLRDPASKNHVPNFEACTDCVRRINLIFPQLPTMFERTELSQEKQCDLTGQSKRFHAYMDRLDKLVSDKKQETIRPSDTQPFVDFAWRLAQTRECERDATITMGTWHFIDELPEFTICEECYDQFVWPMRELPVARLVNKTKKLPPSAKDPRKPEDQKHSCQLYSDRMRSIFVSAVRNNDFGTLMDATKMRRRIEMQHKEMHELYEQDEKRGLDRAAQIRKNAQAWKNFE